MTELAEHRAVITLEHRDPPIRLEVNSLSIEMDEEWIPYVQGSFECPLGDGAIAAVNPQAEDIWASITATRSFGRTDRLRDVSRRYRPRKLSAITADFRGDTLEAVTDAVYHDYSNPGSTRRVDARTWRVMIRSVEVDRKAATATVTFASGEARLFDQQHMATQPDRIAGANMVAKVNAVLAASGFGEGLTFYPSGTPTDAEIGDEAIRVPGSSGIDFITGLTRQHSYMFWCDEDGKFHLATDRTRLNVRKLESAGADRSVVSEVVKRSRDDGWITCVLVIYSWDGKTYYDYFSPLAPNPERALTIRVNRPFPGFGLARQTFYQVRNRGRALDLEAVSVYETIAPGQQVEYTSPRESVRGRLARIRWRFPDDQMSIRLREVGTA